MQREYSIIEHRFLVGEERKMMILASSTRTSTEVSNDDYSSLFEEQITYYGGYN